MNTQNFNQSGGFPLQTETLNNMQTAYDIFNNLGNIAGNFSIILGCQVTGSLVANGVVYINQELLEFRGGQIGTDVIIVEEITAQEFEDGNEKDVLYVRYATFGLGATSFPWINFKRPKTTIELTEQKAEQTLIETLITRITALENRPVANVPIGMIAIWDRPFNEIPVGWSEYQPLRGRMPIGLDPNYDNNVTGDRTNYNLQTLNYNGGKREHATTLEETATHSHKYLRSKDYGSASGNATGHPDLGFDWIDSEAVGGGKAHTNMSPYRVVHFIKYNG
jgi:hypothetical protein